MLLDPRLALLQLQLSLALAPAAAATAATTGSAPGAAAVFRHIDPSQRVTYGIQLPDGRAPLAFVEAEAEDVTSYIRDDPMGPFAAGADRGPEHWESWGFEEGGAEPILKTDWLGSGFWADGSEVFVPRQDAMAPLRRAPPRIVAFVEAFRQVNGACWLRVAEALEGLGKESDEDGEDEELAHLAGIFRRAIANRAHFGEMEAQVWSGGHLVMRSHTDGATAMLHLSLTLGGRRTLRVGKFLERHSPYRDQASRRRGRPPGDEVSVWNREAYHSSELWDVPLEAGNAYLSLPFCFEHGVRYESAGDDAVVALQCRFAFASEAEALEVNGQRTNNMRRIAGAVAGAVAEAADREELRLPSVAEVQALEAQLLVQEPPPAGRTAAGAHGLAAAGSLAAASVAAAMATGLCGRRRPPGLPRARRQRTAAGELSVGRPVGGD